MTLGSEEGQKSYVFQGRIGRVMSLRVGWEEPCLAWEGWKSHAL